MTVAVEKVRQVGIHVPLITAYASNHQAVRGVCNELLDLLRQASYSLRYFTGDTKAAGTPWKANEIVTKIRPRADELQMKLAVLVITAIRRTPLFAP